MKVVIVGGGTSGWLTAASFVHTCPEFDITVIDKETSTPVSVGEATLLGFHNFIREWCGVDPANFLRNTDGVLKSGIYFPDWGWDGNYPWHPFHFAYYPTKNTYKNSIPMCDAWSFVKDKYPLELAYKLNAFSATMYDCSLQNRIDMVNLEDGYAWHIDCLKMVKFLQAKIMDEVTYIQSEVVDISRLDNGNVSTLTLENGQTITGDVFIDCTGFKSILKSHRDRVDLTDRLYVDTAIATHINYEDIETELHPYVTCTAVDHGWIWNIPLQNSIGTGLVFNRSITSVDEAKSYFASHWNNRLDPDDLKVIDWTPYYDKNMWDGNVISIGLSAGFIEPLESTGIALIVEGIANSIRNLQSGYYSQFDIDYFNSFMCFQFEQAIDFVNMHYSVSTKETDFWRYVRENYKMSDTQKFHIESLKSTDRTVMEGKDMVFGGSNWAYWLLMLGYEISEKTYLVDEDIEEGFKKLFEDNQRLLNKDNFMKHTDFISTFIKSTT